MAECVFCLIIQGKIPARKVYEDKETLAFLDINPRVKGHTVVIPKKHVETLLDIDDHTHAALSIAVKKTASLLKHTLHATGFNTGNNNDKTAGQVVPHVHIHILPRFAEDKFNHAGFEAAFPVDENAKQHLDDILKDIQAAIHEDRGDTPGHDEHHEEQHEDHGHEKEPSDSHDSHENSHEKHTHKKDIPKQGVFINDEYPDIDE